MVLVTGGTGFLGAHLLLRLVQNGEKIRALYRNTSHISKTKSLFAHFGKHTLFDSIEWVEADIIDVPSLENVFEHIRIVYHCAALVSFDPKDEELLRKINIEGTANIVNLCLAKNIEKLCHVSSIAALGDLQEHETIITEETEWNPEKFHSDYAISKHGAEMEIWRGQQEGLKTVVVNPGVILGTVFKTGSSEIFAAVAKGLKYYTKGSTGFVAVEDVTEIMIRLTNSAIDGERFVIVGENVSYEKLVGWISEGMKVKAPEAYAQKWLTGVLWRLDWIASNVFGSKRRLSKAMSHSLHSTDLYSNEKIRAVLAIQFRSVEETAKRIAVTYQETVQ